MVCNAACSFPTFGGGSRLTPISRLSATSCVDLEPRPLPSTGVTRLRRYYGPLRRPRRPGLSLAGVRLTVTRCRRWGFPCCVGSPCVCMPSPLPRWQRWVGCRSTVASVMAFPIPLLGRLPHYLFRGLLGVHCALRPACSRDRLTRPFASKASAVSLPPLPPRLLLAGATVARWDLHPLKNDAFARRTVIQE